MVDLDKLSQEEKIEVLIQLAKDAYYNYLHEECADFGYDYQAARKAHQEYMSYVDALKDLGVDFETIKRG